MYPSLGVRRMYLRVVRMTFGLSRPWPVYPNTTALYPVPVRRIRVAAFASFRSHLAVGTLARPCGSCHLGPRRTYTSWIHNMPGAPRKKPPPWGRLRSLLQSTGIEATQVTRVRDLARSLRCRFRFSCRLRPLFSTSIWPDRTYPRGCGASFHWKGPSLPLCAP